METEAEVPAGVSWTWLAVYFSAAFLLDWVKSCFSYPSRPVAVRVLISYYLLTYLLSLCSGLLSETVYQAELYFIYVLLGVNVMKGLRGQYYVSLLVFWQFVIVSGLVICKGLEVIGVRDVMEVIPSKAEIAVINAQTASPVIETAPNREITPIIEAYAGFSWLWLSIYVALALLADWVRACINYRGSFHALRGLIAYYSLNYLLSLCTDYITGGWYLVDYYFICILAVLDVVAILDLSDYLGALVYWHLFLGAIRVVLYGFSAITGWTELLITWVVVPLTVLTLKYGLCTTACFFISLGLLNLVSQYGRAPYQKPQTPQAVSRFAVDFFTMLFLVVGLMLLAWAVMWGFGLLFGGVPWLMEFWYKGMWALLGAGLAYTLMQEEAHFGRELVLMNNFLATLISLYVLGGLASLALG